MATNESINNLPDDIKNQLDLDKVNEVTSAMPDDENVEVDSAEEINEEAETEIETNQEEENEVNSEVTDQVETVEQTQNDDTDISDIADQIINESNASESLILGNLDGDGSGQESISIKNFEKIKNSQNGSSNSKSTTGLINDIEADSFDDPEDDADPDDALTEEAKAEEKREYKFYTNEESVQSANKLDFMKSINVDLNNITIVNKPAIAQVQDSSYIFEKNIATFRVVCCQSAYAACLSGLTLAERNAINNSNLDLYQSKQKLYKTVYNKIQSMNFDKPKFDEWLKITSLGDWNTLLFGVYCQTFIDNNDFDITCGECGKVTEVNVNNQSLAEAKDKGVFDMIEAVTSGPMTQQQLIENSLVHKTTRIMLNESKMIVDIHTPSLWDNLSLIRASKPSVIQEYADAFSSMLFIGHIYQLDVQATYQTKQPQYYELKDRSSILDTLLKLSSNDGEQLEDAIEEKLGKYNITYEIHNCTCQHCKAKLPNIPIDMERILFTRINKERKTKATN
jgi:hypothetical protein